MSDGDVGDKAVVTGRSSGEDPGYSMMCASESHDPETTGLSLKAHFFLNTTLMAGKA
jgi:hypothetical protein